MNKNTNVWAVNTSLPSIEIIQRLAFTFGYSWPNKDQSVNLYNTKYLVFHPTGLLITYTNDINVIEETSNVLVESYLEALRLFKNPPAVGVSKMLPRVTFVYSSANAGVGTRNILAEFIDMDYIKGYDVADGYKYKCFSSQWIAGQISVHELVDYQPK